MDAPAEALAAQRSEQTRATNLSGAVRSAAWALGIFEVIALALLTAWICMQPRVFALYYPLAQGNEKLPDALHVTQWLSSAQPLEKLNGGLLNGELVPKEIVHFNDVRMWFKRLGIAAPIAGAALLAGLILARRHRAFVAAAQVRGLLFIGIVAIFAAMFAIWDWRTFFNWLHEPFFEGTSWRLPRRSYSLQLFPATFWQLMGTTVATLPAVLMATMWAVVRPRSR